MWLTTYPAVVYKLFAINLMFCCPDQVFDLAYRSSVVDLLGWLVLEQNIHDWAFSKIDPFQIIWNGSAVHRIKFLTSPIDRAWSICYICSVLEQNMHDWAFSKIDPFQIVWNGSDQNLDPAAEIRAIDYVYVPSFKPISCSAVDLCNF